MNATRAWLILVALSAASTLLAWSNAAGMAVTLAILAFSWGKAQIILRDYLGLAEAPGWSRGFALVLGFYMLLMMGLAIAAQGAVSNPVIH